MATSLSPPCSCTSPLPSTGDLLALGVHPMTNGFKPKAHHQSCREDKRKNGIICIWRPERHEPPWLSHNSSVLSLTGFNCPIQTVLHHRAVYWTYWTYWSDGNNASQMFNSHYIHWDEEQPQVWIWVDLQWNTYFLWRSLGWRRRRRRKKLCCVTLHVTVSLNELGLLKTGYFTQCKRGTNKKGLIE